jgi:hypothetical protein
MTESGFHFINDYLKCQRYFEWRYIHKLVPKHPSTKLLLGQAVHKALELMFKAPAVFKYTREELLQSFMVAMEGLRLQYVTDEDFDGDLITGRALLNKFFDDQGHKYWKPLAVEQELAVCFVDHDVVASTLTGRLDLVVEAPDGLVHIVDHKTTGWSIALLCQSLSISDQASAYLLLWNTNHPERPASGVIYNILRKCRSVVEVAQHPVTRNEPDIQRFKRDAHYVLKEIKRKTTTADQVFPMNTGACHLYNRPCAYMDLCRGVNFEGLIGTVFVIDETGLGKEFTDD